MKCYCIRYMPKPIGDCTGEGFAHHIKEVFVMAETMYEALFDWRAFDIRSVELMGEAR